MSATSIRATSLSKRYELGRNLNRHTTLRESLVDSAGAALRTLPHDVFRRADGVLGAARRDVRHRAW